ncbi:MAG: hypothetical protein ACRD3J_15150 [Thermoanaerobaculia bacterium]
MTVRPGSGMVSSPPAGWSEAAAGPPPSDSGIYILSQFAFRDSRGMAKANVLVSAVDLLVAPEPSRSASELIEPFATVSAASTQSSFRPRM